MDKRILVLAGPTGVGESTITNEIIKRFPIFKRLTTATSRKPRGNEKNKIDYYFFSEENFRKEISSGNILEYTYIENRNTYYGAYKPDLEDKLNSGFNIIVNVDIVGAKYYKEHFDSTTIFIAPESLDDLKERIKKRSPDISSEELDKRMRNAKDEMEKEMPYYDFIVVNAEGQLDKAVEEIVEIIKNEGYELS